MASHWKQWQRIWCFRLMVCERGRWCLSRSCGGQPKRDVTRSAVTLSPSVQNNTRNQLLLWESLQHQGPNWEPVYPCVVQPCPGRTYTHTQVPSLVYQASSFGVCRLTTAVIVTTTSHLPFVYSNNKVIGTLFEGPNKETWITFLLLFVISHPQTVWCILRNIQKISSYCKTAGPQSSFRNLFQYDSSSIQLLEPHNEQLN